MASFHKYIQQMLNPNTSVAYEDWCKTREYDNMSKNYGMNKKLVMSVSKHHQKMNEDFYVCDTVCAMMNRSEEGSYLWYLAGFEGIPAKISSYLTNSDGQVVKRMLRLNFLDKDLLEICCRVVCSGERRIHILDYTQYGGEKILGKNCKRCNNAICPFRIKNKCKVANIMYRLGRHTVSYALSKLSADTWDVDICGINFSKYIIRETIGKKMETYAQNIQLKTDRLANPLPGWGLTSKDEGRQQLVGTTFRTHRDFMDNGDYATYTIQKVCFGKRKNINGFIVDSTLDGFTSSPFKVDVKAYQDGFHIRILFCRLYPFPPMERAFYKRFLYNRRIFFSSNPDLKIWLSSSTY